MTEFQEKAAVINSRQLTEDTFCLSFHSPKIASKAMPGQFVMVTCGSTYDPLLRRPFSIHKVTKEGGVQIYFKVVGKGTNQLAKISSNDILDVIGPLGKGFQLGIDGPVCLVGGGMGIAPLLFLAEELLSRKRKTSSDKILLGARNAIELKELKESFEILGYEVKCATDDGSLGYHGFVTDLLDEGLHTVNHAYICGPYPMMAIAAAKCSAKRVDCEVSMEAHMACGLGACLGCTIHTANESYFHVCKDGPVFMAKEVAWQI